MTPQMIALYAVMRHGIKHGLDHPATINTDDRSVTLFCRDGSWSDTIYVDDHRCEPPTRSGWVRVAADGRLPDSGTRVTVIWWEQFASVG